MTFSDRFNEVERSALNRINKIDSNVIAEIQEELNACDIISLLFILEENHDILLEQTTQGSLFLHDWALRMEAQPRARLQWKLEFLEALAVCQLFSIIKKLGVYVPFAKDYFQPDKLDVTRFIKPLKKALYKLCDNMDFDKLRKLRDKGNECGIDIQPSDPCEVVLLKFTSCGLDVFGQLAGDSAPSSDPESTSEANRADVVCTMSAILRRLNINDVFVKDSKIRVTNLSDVYRIKNTRRVGVCFVINQRKFHSVDYRYPPLDERAGSNWDAINISRTMSALNFEIIYGEDLTSENIFKELKVVLTDNINKDDTIFMLCILSHGVKDHIFGSDSIKVRVEDIQNVLEGTEGLRDIVKVLVIAACQADETKECAPPFDPKFYVTKKISIKRDHFLLSWATLPSLEASRFKSGYGSIYIISLCKTIRDYAARLDMYNILTKVTRTVRRFCEKRRYNQTPRFESTLEKILYLRDPR